MLELYNSYKIMIYCYNYEFPYPIAHIYINSQQFVRSHIILASKLKSKQYISIYVEWYKGIEVYIEPEIKNVRLYSLLI